MHIPPQRIVLSGGGIRGVAYVGVFMELEKHGFLKNIKEVLGVSCGAMFGFAHILGYSTSEMFSLASSLDFSLLQNIDPDVALNYFITYYAYFLHAFAVKTLQSDPLYPVSHLLK